MKSDLLTFVIITGRRSAEINLMKKWTFEKRQLKIMNSSFLNILMQCEFNLSEIQAVEECCEEKNIQKGTILLKPGQEQWFIWFNSKGLFKYYYIDFEGTERIKHFAVEDDFILSISAILENINSKFFIEAMENAVIVEIPTDFILRMIKQSSNWNRLFNLELIKSLLKKEEREAELLLEKAESRYLNFIKNYPDLANRLKIYEIAAYLGINHAHLSRIRKTITKG